MDDFSGGRFLIYALWKSGLYYKCMYLDFSPNIVKESRVHKSLNCNIIASIRIFGKPHIILRM